MNVEEIIRRAEREGKFSEVAGKGKPLNLADRVETDVVQSVVKQAGFVPGWVALGKEIDGGLEQWERLRATFEAAYPATVARIRDGLARRLGPQAGPEMESAAGRLNSWWDRTVADLAKLGTELNRQIDDYNLITPRAHHQHPRLKVRDTLLAFADRYPRLAFGDEAAVAVLRPSDSRPLVEQALAACAPPDQPARCDRSWERAQALANYVATIRSRRR